MQSLQDISLIESRIYSQKPDISQASVKRYSKLIQQLLSEISVQQIKNDPMSIEKTSFCVKNIKSLRLYYQAILSYFGHDFWDQQQQTVIQRRIFDLNGSEHDQIAFETIQESIPCSQKDFELTLIELYRKAFQKFQRGVAKNQYSGLCKFIILMLLYRYNQRVGVFSNMNIVSCAENQIKKISNYPLKYAIYDQEGNEMTGENYIVVLPTKMIVLINQFKTKNKYSQLSFELQNNDILDEALVNTIKILLERDHTKISKIGSTQMKQVGLSIGVKQWTGLSSNQISKLGINCQLREDITSLKQISKQRGTHLSTIYGWYVKQNNPVNNTSSNP